MNHEVKFICLVSDCLSLTECRKGGNGLDTRKRGCGKERGLPYMTSEQKVERWINK